MVSAEENAGDDACDHHRLGVFGDEEQAALEPRVLEEVADDLRLTFRRVEGRALDLRLRGDEEEDGPDGLEEDAPRRQPAEDHRVVVDQPLAAAVGERGGRAHRRLAHSLQLRHDVEPQGAEDDERADQGQTEGHFIRDQLRRGAQAAEERQLVVRGPAGERRAEDRHRGQRKDVKDAPVDAGDLQLHARAPEVELGADRHHREEHEGGREGQERGEVK